MPHACGVYKMFASIITAISSIASPIIDRILPDQEAAQKAKHELILELTKNESAFQLSIAEIIKAEASSRHWLAANWRPITMLVFVGLIVARWFGFAAPNLTEAEYLKLWSIVELGLGGYVIGRSVEKSLPSLANLLKK